MQEPRGRAVVNSDLLTALLLLWAPHDVAYWSHMHAPYALLAMAIIAEVPLAVSIVWFFRRALNTPVFLQLIEKTELAGDRMKGAKICLACEGAVTARYCQFLFGLEIERRTLGAFSDGFRDAVPAVGFQEVVREESARVRRYFESQAHRAGIAGVVGAVAAIVASLAYLQLYGQWPFKGLAGVDGPSKAALVMAGTAILLGQSVARSWAGSVRALRLVENAVLPRLKPKEEMSEGEREAAELSRKHAVFKASSDTMLQR